VTNDVLTGAAGFNKTHVQVRATYSGDKLVCIYNCHCLAWPRVCRPAYSVPVPEPRNREGGLLLQEGLRLCMSGLTLALVRVAAAGLLVVIE